MEADPVGESKRMVFKNAYLSAQIIAIAILNREWKIKLLTPLFAKYLLWHLTPQTILKLSVIVLTIGNIGDFINAIR